MSNDDVIVDEELQDYFEKGDFSTLEFKHIYDTYSHWRIKEIFLLYYNIEVRTIYGGYKANRYRSCLRYQLVDMFTNEIIGNEYGYTLEVFRYFLAEQGFPLHGDKETKKLCAEKRPQKPKRRESCEQFLAIVNRLNSPDNKGGSDL